LISFSATFGLKTLSSMKNLLLPIDFSDNSVNAAKYAVSLASLSNSKIYLFHCSESSVPTLENYSYLPEYENMEAENLKMLQEIAAYLNEVNPEVRIECISSVGILLDNIKRLTEKLEINLVVMGTTGASGLKEIFLGSNTSHAIENLDCPVLAIPEHTKFSPIKNIFYATDFQSEDIQIIHSLCGLSKLNDAEVIVGHISTPETKSKDAELLEWFMELSGPKICCQDIRFILHENQDFFEGINEIIKNESLDMVALSTAKKSFFNKIFGVNHTKTLACHLEVPLLAFHLNGKNNLSDHHHHSHTSRGKTKKNRF
jgi:nucleotide-binding universal stress UspA family protein